MNKQLAVIGEVLVDYNSGECSAKDALTEIQEVLEDTNLSLENEVWDLIKKYPEELGFVLQEKDYVGYCETYRNPETATIDPTEIILTEEQFNTIKNFFNQRERRE